MPRYEIIVPDHLQAGLATLVGRYNADNGAELTVRDWLQLHAAELAIQTDLVTEHQRLTESINRDIAAGLKAYKDRLIAGDAPPEEGDPA